MTGIEQRVSKTMAGALCDRLTADLTVIHHVRLATRCLMQFFSDADRSIVS